MQVYEFVTVSELHEMHAQAINQDSDSHSTFVRDHGNHQKQQLCSVHFQILVSSKGSSSGPLFWRKVEFFEQIQEGDGETKLVATVSLFIVQVILL